MQGMLTRWTTPKIEKGLAEVPAVGLLGARQIGKTTLAKIIAKRKKNSIYLDLESPEDLLKLNDPISFLSSHPEKLIILDEIQRVPDLFPVLRGLIDKNSQKKRKNGQFLLLGSASVDLLRQSSESLAGRIRYTPMSGLNILEIGQKKSEQQKLWLTGGFPEGYLAKNSDVAMDWIEGLIRTYLERDIPQFGFQVPAARLRRLWTMLGHLQGETLNINKLATNLEVSRTVVYHYLDILTDLLLVRRLEPWHANVKKRLVKSPRYYIRDSGIHHRLLNIDSFDALLSNPILGKSWEGFVIENIHSVLPRRAQTYFYRTAAGAEIDLVVQMPNQKIWAIEVKYGVAPQLSKHYNRICEEIGATKKYIVYGGNDEFEISKNITMISLHKLMQKVSVQAT